ncbi:MAG TPA: MGMT family protein [Gemmatimonadaceae bacterium]|nr:MGMT family protein [Gemmatimonadaceae bacterium]
MSILSVDGEGAGLHQRIHAVVSRIPRGRVATYGQIARLAGLAGQARLVGYAMHALPTGSKIPWHRVINAKGEISIPGESGTRQHRLLEREGVRFDARGRIALSTYQWRPAK